EQGHGLGIVLVELQRAGELRIEAWNGRSQAECRIDQTVGAGAGAAGCDRGAAGAGADGSAESAHAAARSVLHNAGIDAQNVGSRPGAEHVGLGDVQVIARDVKIEIVFESEGDGVIDRKIYLSLSHERVDTRRVAQ